MKRRRPEAVAAPPLKDDEATILLGGWAARRPGVAENARVDVGFWLFLDGDDGFVQAWHKHETWLRDCASRWGIEPRHYIRPANEHNLRFVTSEPRGDELGPFFYCEALALAGPQRADGGTE